MLVDLAQDLDHFGIIIHGNVSGVINVVVILKNRIIGEQLCHVDLRNTRNSAEFTTVLFRKPKKKMLPVHLKYLDHKLDYSLRSITLVVTVDTRKLRSIAFN